MKNVVITGSTRGIGLAMAKEFMNAGCNLTLSGRQATITDALTKELQEYKGMYHYVPCNVRDRSDIENLWAKAYEQWKSVDIWINNAGQNCPHEFCYDTPASSVDAVIDTNIKGMIYR